MFPPSGARLQASHHLKPNSLHFVLGKPFLCSIIKLVVPGLSCAAIYWACSSAPPFNTSSSWPKRADRGRLHRGADRATLKSLVPEKSIATPRERHSLPPQQASSRLIIAKSLSDLRPASAAQTELPTPGTSQGRGSSLTPVLSTMP
jgi:hypothetical protein